MSREAWQRIVDGYESFDPRRMFEDVVCLHEVSKKVNGKYEVINKDEQECPELGCRTRKHHDRFKMEMTAGPCDSDISRKLLDGVAEGELVTAYKDADRGQRGGFSGAFKWGGRGSTLVGRTFAVINAGTHYDPLNRCEECKQPYHAEAWLRAAIVDGEHVGCRVAGSMAFNFDPAGEEGEAGVFVGNFEGLLICQCKG